MVSKQRGRVQANRPATGEGQQPRPARQGASPGSARPGWLFALLTPGFAALGACLMLVEDNATAPSRIYTSTPEFKVWATLTVAVIAALPAVWRVGVDLLTRLDARRDLRLWAAPEIIGVALVVAAAVLAGEYARGSGSAYYGGVVRIGVVYALAVAAAVPAFLAIWECYRRLAVKSGPDEQGSTADVSRLLLLRGCLLSALTTVGLLVSAGVLNVGAERQAVLADPKHAAPFPSAYVLIWGLAFSALLVINFLPAFRRLIRIANATIDATFPILPPGCDGWQNRLQERSDLADLLQVTSGAKDVITSAILVAGPLISSAFSLFLPGSPSG